MPAKYGGTAQWEFPSGKLLGELFNAFTHEFESKLLLTTKLKLSITVFVSILFFQQESIVMAIPRVMSSPPNKHSNEGCCYHVLLCLQVHSVHYVILAFFYIILIMSK